MYEYNTQVGDGLPSPEKLKEWEEEGWELVTIIKHDTDGYVIYLRRQATSS